MYDISFCVGNIYVCCFFMKSEAQHSAVCGLTRKERRESG